MTMSSIPRAVPKTGTAGAPTPTAPSITQGVYSMRNRTPYPTTSHNPSAGRPSAGHPSAGHPSAGHPSAGHPSEPLRFSITEKGLRACGAAQMEKAAARLRQMADDLSQAIPAAARELRQIADDQETAARRLSQELPAFEDAGRTKRRRGKKLKMLRRGTVCGRYRNASNTRVPDLRLCGLWLKGAGFDLGRKYEVHVDDRKLTIRAQERHASTPAAGITERRSESTPVEAGSARLESSRRRSRAS